MQDINLTGPLMDAVIASVTTGTTATLTVADIDATIAQLDQHGGTQSLTVTGNIVAGVFLGSSFSLRLHTNKPTMRYTFGNLVLARQFARRCNYPATVVLGDRDSIWVVSFGEAARLVKQGYQLAN